MLLHTAHTCSLAAKRSLGHAITHKLTLTDEQSFGHAIAHKLTLAAKRPFDIHHLCLRDIFQTEDMFY